MLGGIFPHFKKNTVLPSSRQTLELFFHPPRLSSFQLLSYLHLFEFPKGDQHQIRYSIKPRFDVTRNVSVKVFSPDFVDERIGIGIQQLTTIPPSLTCHTVTDISVSYLN